MGLWIRLDIPEDLETRQCPSMPTNGDWIGLAEAVRIIREHNDREARKEQTVTPLRPSDKPTLPYSGPQADHLVLTKQHEDLIFRAVWAERRAARLEAALQKIYDVQANENSDPGKDGFHEDRTDERQPHPLPPPRR